MRIPSWKKIDLHVGKFIMMEIYVEHWLPYKDYIK